MIKNKLNKAILNGADTHSASLSGTASQSGGTNTAAVVNGGTTNFAFRPAYQQLFDDNGYCTVNITPPANSVVVCSWTGFDNAGGQAGAGWLRRNTTNLVATTIGGFGRYVDLTPGTSATNYNLMPDRGDDQTFQTQISLSIVAVVLTDTHGGQLDGADTHAAFSKSINGLIT